MRLPPNAGSSQPSREITGARRVVDGLVAFERTGPFNGLRMTIMGGCDFNAPGNWNA